MVSVVI